MENLTQKEADIVKQLAALGLDLSPAELSEMKEHRRQWLESTSPEDRARLRLLQEFNHLELVN